MNCVAFIVARFDSKVPIEIVEIEMENVNMRPELVGLLL